jgi:hypothetical protein
MEEQLHTGLLDMERAKYHRLLSQKKNDAAWLKRHYEYYQQMLDNTPGDSNPRKIDALNRLCGSLEDHAEMATTEMLRPDDISIKKDQQVANNALGIIRANLSHDFDVRNLVQRVDNLFKWTDDPTIRKLFLAPYFALIQSSGMGKTKLLYECKKKMDQEPGMVVKLLLSCIGKSEEEKSEVHEPLVIPTDDPSPKARKEFTDTLDQLVIGAEGKKVVLLVDEAQHLLGSDHRGFYFRCFQHWLRLKEKKYKVVAVFAGTALQLSNAFEEKQQTHYSRGLPSPHHEEKGIRLYDPFFELTTSGAGKKDVPSGTTEFRKAIRYGRPLFHEMEKAGLFDERRTLEEIKERLQLCTLPIKQPLSWLSVLSARVQMGQTTSAAVSAMVAHGYANLTHFKSLQDVGGDVIMQHCHFPDPVLARAAMEIMNEDRKKWSTHAMELFSVGLCTPAKGNIGEIAAALYMLFCGDELRAKNGRSLDKFSVSLHEWLEKMGAVAIISPKVKVNKSVNFIQFCQSYVRLDAGEIARNEVFLEELYQSACGIYLYPGSEACDILAAVACRTKSGPKRLKRNESNIEGGGDHDLADSSYEALLVSVKNCKEVTNTQMGVALAAMVQQLVNAGLQRGVCLLILAGLTNDENLLEEDAERVHDVIIKEAKMTSTQSTSRTTSVEDKEAHAVAKEMETPGARLTQNDCCDISCFVVRVKNNDKYGVSNILQCATVPGGEHSEMFASHFALGALLCESSAESFLRLGKRNPTKEEDCDLKFTEDLSRALSVLGMGSDHARTKKKKGSASREVGDEVLMDTTYSW